MEPDDVTGSAASLTFFSKTFDEARQLLVGARDYFSNADPASAPGLTAEQRLRMRAESLRVTTRLGHVMAWLLAQKAWQAGEITRQEAAGPQFRLDGGPACLEETEETVPGLPERLRELLADSRRLYIRVARLDDLVQRAAVGA